MEEGRISEELIEEEFVNKGKIKENITFQIIFLGILTILAVTATAILHTNEFEFIILQFPLLEDWEVSLFDTVLYAAYLIMGVIIGIIANRLGKRKIFIIIGSLGSIVFYFLMTIAKNYYLLLSMRFLQGCFTVMVWQILMTIILDLSTQDNRGKNMGIYGIFLALGMGLGPMLGGLLAKWDVLIPYYAAAVLNGIIFVLALFLLKEPQDVKNRPSLKQTLLIAKNSPRLVIPGLFNFIDRLHMGFIIFMLPLFLADVLHLDPSLRGMSLGLFALPFILLQYPMGKLSDKIGRYILLIFGSIFYGIILCIIGYVGSFGFPYLLVLLFILGIFSGVTSPPSMALVGDIVKKEDNAMGMSFFNFLGNIGITIGPLVGGFLIKYGYGLAFLVVGIIEIIALCINVLIVRFVFKESLNHRAISASKKAEIISL